MTSAVSYGGGYRSSSVMTNRMFGDVIPATCAPLGARAHPPLWAIRHGVAATPLRDLTVGRDSTPQRSPCEIAHGGVPAFGRGPLPQRGYGATVWRLPTAAATVPMTRRRVIHRIG